MSVRIFKNAGEPDLTFTTSCLLTTPCPFCDQQLPVGVERSEHVEVCRYLYGSLPHSEELTLP